MKAQQEPGLFAATAPAGSAVSLAPLSLLNTTVHRTVTEGYYGGSKRTRLVCCNGPSGRCSITNAAVAAKHDSTPNIDRGILWRLNTNQVCLLQRPQRALQYPWRRCRC